MWVLLLALAQAIEDIDYFHTGIFEANRDPGLYEVKIGLEDTDSILSTFGYYNKDKYCDIVVLSGSKKTLIVYLWDNGSSKFTKSDTLQIQTNGTIISAIPGDINYDGLLDLVVTLKQDSDTFLHVYFQSPSGFVPNQSWQIPEGSQPSLLDINGDRKLEIIVNYQYNVTAEAVVILYQNNEFSIQPLHTFGTDDDNNCMIQSSFLLSTPHSVASVDLNKDCLADLFLTTVDESGDVSFEFWLNMKNGKYCKRQKTPAPKGAGQVSFADVDRNGVEDLIFPVCIGADCTSKQEIHIVFNDNDASSTCTYHYGGVKDFQIDDIGDKEITGNKMIIKIDQENSFYSLGNDFPFTIRFGDMDLDGYPDFLVTMKPKDTEAAGHAYLFENVDCDEEHCGKAENRRFFERSKKSEYDKIAEDPGVFIATFFDLDENGVLDILTVSYSGEKFQTKGFYNNFLNDAFHLKALALNGYQKQEYSSAYPGAVFMFTLTELDMSKVQMHSTQMPQTAYFALNTPYCVYGLGRTNSYIEEFYVAMPVGHKDSSYSKLWTPIIPNSYLIASPKGSPDNWFLELFASPTDKIGLIIAISAGCLVIIGIIVVWKYHLERKEDKKKFSIRF
ncbi:unnamed protein product [Blepharisma stoltei]|uniref:T-cell immunomodulatory protein TIP C2 domain-containing protein n=1 Tax=Blepharisma stoltei TaxID=1481888 RepID=A0AAU9IJ81_9CILI|nr:unnamed protein product [Blepharisma stoltei]